MFLFMMYQSYTAYMKCSHCFLNVKYLKNPKNISIKDYENILSDVSYMSKVSLNVCSK